MAGRGEQSLLGVPVVQDYARTERHLEGRVKCRYWLARVFTNYPNSFGVVQDIHLFQSARYAHAASRTIPSRELCTWNRFIIVPHSTSQPSNGGNLSSAWCDKRPKDIRGSLGAIA